MTDINSSAKWAASLGRERFLPDFRSINCTFMLLLGELFAFMFTLAVVASPQAFWPELGLNSLFIVSVVLASQLLLAIAAKHLDKLTEKIAGFCVFLVVTFISLLLTWLLEGLCAEASGPLFSREQVNLPFQSLSHSVLAGMTTAVGLRYQYLQYLLRLQVKAEGAARLDALQSRMKPHFLFNSLNSIAILIRQDSTLAEALTLDLADLFRAILRKDIRLTTLEDEIGLSRQYLNIEQLRLGERLRVVWSLNEDLFGALIPPLSLQPLIENAIFHGIDPSPAGGTLEISCQAHKKNKIILSVRNSLPDSCHSAARLGNRVALNNLRLRLHSFFGDDGKLMTSIVEGVYLARIVIPYTFWHDHENPAG